MASLIDETIPIEGTDPGPTTESMRNNFGIAKAEITDLQDVSAGALQRAGGAMLGDLLLADLTPTALSAVPRRYVDNLFTGTATLIGVINAATGQVTYSRGSGYPDGPLIEADEAGHGTYVITGEPGTVPGGPLDGEPLTTGDWVISNGEDWVILAVAPRTILAANVGVIPEVLDTDNVQDALEALDAEKLALDGGTMRGKLVLTPAQQTDNNDAATRAQAILRNNPGGGAQAMLTPLVLPHPPSLGISQEAIAKGYADDNFLNRGGGQMTGAIIGFAGSATNPTYAFSENSTGWYRAGTSICLSINSILNVMFQPTGLFMSVPLNMATQQIQNVAQPREGAPGNGDGVPRSYVDNQVNTRILRSGDTMTGPLLLRDTFTDDREAVSKAYVDAIDTGGPGGGETIVQASGRAAWLAGSDPAGGLLYYADKPGTITSLVGTPTVSNTGAASVQVHRYPANSTTGAPIGGIFQAADAAMVDQDLLTAGPIALATGDRLVLHTNGVFDGAGGISLSLGLGAAGGGLPDYSFDEQPLGITWVNGQELFIKTIDCGYMPTHIAPNNWKRVAHGVSDLNLVVEIEGIALQPPDEGGGAYAIKLPGFITTDPDDMSSIYVDTTTTEGDALPGGAIVINYGPRTGGAHVRTAYRIFVTMIYGRGPLPLELPALPPGINDQPPPHGNLPA